MTATSSKLVSSHDTTELIFLGTGTSSGLPHIECLTALPGDKQCKTCLSTLKPEGRKNARRNTSAAFRITTKKGRKVTIVIDAGKSFGASALEWFPKYGLRRIDALLITHAHADAMNGLDDLRGWTLNNAIQSHIDVYLSLDTFAEVRRAFPYLVAKEYASGGGAVPDFEWHIIDDSVPFEILDTGIKVTPFSVHHGRIFSLASPQPSPPDTVPSSPNGSLLPLLSNPHSEVVHRDEVDKKTEVIRPYLCFGFKIGDEVAYLSDVSHIPDDKWDIIASEGGERLPLLVLDCLRLRPYTSHYGLGQAVETARRIGASRTYLTGFGHEVTHDEYISLGEVIGGKELDDGLLTDTVREGLELVCEGRDIWLRPAHDGLRVVVGDGGAVLDESY